MKILILCNDFPPLNSIGAQRPYSWFLHLKKFGIEPTIITKNWSTVTEANTLPSAETVIEKDEKGKIIRVPIRMILPEKIQQSYGMEKFASIRKALTLIYKTLSFISFRFDKHADIYFEARKLLSKESFDAILITGEPFVIFRYGYLLAKKFHIPWVADYRDGWKVNYVMAFRNSIPYRLLRWWEFIFEKRYLSNVSFIQTVDPLLAGKLQQLLHKETEVVYNGFDEFYNYDTELKTNPEKLLLVHAGTITPGQRVEFLLSAIKELHEEKKITPADLLIEFIGIEYFPEQCNRILQFDKNIAPYIETTPRITRSKTLDISAAGDYLLNFTEEKSKVINAKTYDYLSLKKQIIVLPDDNSILSGLVKDLNAGRSFETVTELKEFLLKSVALKKKGLLDTSAPVNVEGATFYTREKQTEVLAEIFRKRLNRTG